ncbi:MAG: endodeoxyribonuclease RusA [Variovorax sp.]|nr:endodeoxyribonuclease RusA [Variovorax sp.]
MKWILAVTVKLPYPISANRYFRDRVIPAKGTRAALVQRYVTKEARDYQESVGWLLKNAGVRQAITGRVRVDLQLHPHCPQDWRARQRKDPLWWADTVQRLDLDNCRKVLIDALKGVAIVDDVQVWKDSGEVMEPREDVEACVVLRISRGVKDNPQEALPL